VTVHHAQVVGVENSVVAQLAYKRGEVKIKRHVICRVVQRQPKVERGRVLVTHTKRVHCSLAVRLHTFVVDWHKVPDVADFARKLHLVVAKQDGVPWVAETRFPVPLRTLSRCHVYFRQPLIFVFRISKTKREKKKYETSRSVVEGIFLDAAFGGIEEDW